MVPDELFMHIQISCNDAQLSLIQRAFQLSPLVDMVILKRLGREVQVNESEVPNGGPTSVPCTINNKGFARLIHSFLEE